MTLALRADIDGLPIPENNPHLEYSSKTSFAHMCGHDGHTVIMLGVVSELFMKSDRFSGTVKCLF